MLRKNFLPLLIALFLLVLPLSTAEAGMSLFRRGRSGAGGGPFPGTGDIPDLVHVGKIATYKPENMGDFYGTAGNRYIEYGMVSLMSADYTYGGKERRINLEIVTMDTPIAAAGLFHYHRGKVLRTPGESVDIGAEGILDTGRGKRNLYFYRSKMFVKIVYSGDPPVPDLLAIAQYVDERLPQGRDDKPDGLEYIKIDGINEDTIAITHGFTFNIDFLPASVWASAPGGGSPASDLFIITRMLDRDAQDLFRDYTGYLKLYAKYIEEYEREGLKYTKAVDPNQGRVVFTCYRNAVILAVRPDGYDKGEALIDLVIDRIDEVKGGGSRGEGKSGRRSLNPFRRNR